MIADGDPDGVLPVQLGVGDKRFAAGVDGLYDSCVVGFTVAFSSPAMTEAHG